MKKVMSLMVMSLICLFPLVTKADKKIEFSCTDESNDVRSCVVAAKLTGDDVNVSDLTIKLTEEGGATITDIIDMDWSVTSKPYSNGVYTVKTNGMGSGEVDLFTFKYQKSGQADCLVRVGFDNTDVPETGTPTTPTPSTDTPTDNKQTGATLPYIALGAVALIAAGTYVVTRNKTKMYKI